MWLRAWKAIRRPVGRPVRLFGCPPVAAEQAPQPRPVGSDRVEAILQVRGRAELVVVGDERDRARRGPSRPAGLMGDDPARDRFRWGAPCRANSSRPCAPRTRAAGRRATRWAAPRRWSTAGVAATRCRPWRMIAIWPPCSKVSNLPFGDQAGPDSRGRCLQRERRGGRAVHGRSAAPSRCLRRQTRARSRVESADTEAAGATSPRRRRFDRSPPGTRRGQPRPRTRA